METLIPMNLIVVLQTSLNDNVATMGNVKLTSLLMESQTVCTSYIATCIVLY